MSLLSIAAQRGKLGDVRLKDLINTLCTTTALGWCVPLVGNPLMAPRASGHRIFQAKRPDEEEISRCRAPRRPLIAQGIEKS